MAATPPLVAPLVEAPPVETAHGPTLDDVRAAAQRLEGVSLRTPVEASRAVSDLAGCDVLLKCEHLQRTGSFKIRGAYNRISRLDDDERAAGVVCASAGNHAQGVALAAQLLGVRATVYMPTDAPLPKLSATQGYGAEVVLHGDVFDAALDEARAVAERTGRVFVPPFDHEHIIAGQGTLGLEIVEQVPDVATVVVPIGGGGMIAGTAIAMKALRPDVRIVGVQATGCASISPSLARGEPVTADGADTICDGIAVKRPGALTLPHIAELVDEVVEVDDADTARALVLLLERAKQLVEPSGAIGVGALLSGRVDLEPPAVVVLSGGNIDPLMLNHLVTSGMTAEGRYVTLRTRVGDQPGSLALLLDLVAEEQGNVVGVEHHRLGRRLRLGMVEVVLELEMRGHEHIRRMRRVLADNGYPVTLA